MLFIFRPLLLKQKERERDTLVQAASLKKKVSAGKKGKAHSIQKRKTIEKEKGRERERERHWEGTTEEEERSHAYMFWRLRFVPPLNLKRLSHALVLWWTRQSVCVLAGGLIGLSLASKLPWLNKEHPSSRLIPAPPRQVHFANTRRSEKVYGNKGSKAVCVYVCVCVCVCVWPLQTHTHTHTHTLEAS